MFLAPPWPEIYAQDAERRQSIGTARRTCEAVAQAYTDCGYELVELPRLPPRARLRFLLNELNWEN